MIISDFQLFKSNITPGNKERKTVRFSEYLSPKISNLPVEFWNYTYNFSVVIRSKTTVKA